MVSLKSTHFFQGGWVDGQKTGYGEYFYKNGDSYKGQVKLQKPGENFFPVLTIFLS